MTKRLNLYLYASDTFAEVYDMDSGANLRIPYDSPLAQERIEFLIDGVDTADSIVKGNEVGLDLALTDFCDYYDLADCRAHDVDPHDAVPFTVFMSYMAHDWEEFGAFLERLDFNHEHIDIKCNDWAPNVANPIY